MHETLWILAQEALVLLGGILIGLACTWYWGVVAGGVLSGLVYILQVYGRDVPFDDHFKVHIEAGAACEVSRMQARWQLEDSPWSKRYTARSRS